MRIIAGEYRSRILAAPRGSKTRPTGDRLRETLFNILGPRVQGSRFADLYAGSGAVGIEALSRGARHVHFAENALPAIAAIRENLKTLGINKNFMVHERTALGALERLREQGSAQDIVFLDPPYEAEREYAEILRMLGGGAHERLLALNAFVIAERSTRAPLAEHYGHLQRTRERKQGAGTLSFYQIKI